MAIGARPENPTAAERARPFRTISLRPVDEIYRSRNIADVDYARLGDPGVYPYTRGIRATGYGAKLGTMRQFAGFGTPESTNQRYRHLLEAGGTGLSVA